MPGAAPPLSRAQRALVFSGIMLGLSLAALDLMMIATAVPSIVGELGDLSQVSWVFTAYLLTSTCGMPLWGKLGDLYGRRRAFQVAIGIFIAGSIAAGTSQTMTQLVLARALQGVGGGALVTLPQAILGDLVPPRARGRYVGFTTGVWAVSSIAGPLIGGFLVDGPGWRWIFYVNLGSGLLAAGMLSLGFRLPQGRVARAVDVPGALLAVTGVGALLLATSWAGSRGAASAPVLALLLAAAGLLAGFAAWERRAPEPLLPLAMFRVPVVRAATLANFLFGLATFAIAIFVPLFVVVVMGRSATAAGLMLMPISVGVFLASIGVGRRIARTGRYRAYPPVGLALYLVSLVLLRTLGPDTPVALGWSYTFLAGIGMGTFTPVVLIALQNAVPYRDLGVASALATWSRHVASSIGSAALGAILATRLAHHLAPLAAATREAGALPGALRSSPELIHGLPEPLRAGAVEAFRAAIADALLVMLAVAVLALAAAFLFRDVPLRETVQDEPPGGAPAGAPAPDVP